MSKKTLGASPACRSLALSGHTALSTQMLPNDPRQTTAEWFARESLAAERLT